MSTSTPERWRYSQQQRLGDIFRGVHRPINGEPPLATRAFEAARRAAAHQVHLPDSEEALGLYPSWYEGTPTAQVAEAVERLADEVERIARVHRAPRPAGYRHDVAVARQALDEIVTRCGWFHREWDRDLGSTGPRWGRYEGDPSDEHTNIGPGRVVGPLAEQPDHSTAWLVTCRAVICDRLPSGVAVVR